jgi:acetyl-CoA carboxylase biotin carboxyl carrier protein
MLQDSDLREIEVKEGEESVRIARGIETPSNSLQSTQANISSTSNDQDITSASSGSSIKSPIVGTFYRKPSPDKPPYVELGDHVNTGDVVCIVEAMKMMNEIKSEFTGIVTAISVEDGEPVEFDQSLIIID